MSITKNDNAVVMNRDSLQYLANCIRLVHSLPELLNDVLPSQTTTYSSYKVTELLNTLNKDLQDYVNSALGNLSHLKKEIASTVPTSDVAEENTIYLVENSTTGGFDQYLLINGNIENLGNTASIGNTYTKTESDSKYASLSTLNSLINSVGTLNDLPTTDKTSIVNAIKEVFQSVSNGKSLIASAITDKGVDTSNTDTFTTMAENILNIVGGSGDLTDIYNALQYHNLLVNGKETSELIGNYIKALLIPRTLTEETTNVTLFTDLIDDTIHDIEINENANGTVLVCDNNLNGTVSDGYKEFESINKSDFVTNISFA